MIRHQVPKPTICSIIGCPFEGGQPKPGAAQGPRALIATGLEAEIKGLGWTIAEVRILEELLKLSQDKSMFQNKVKNAIAVGEANKLISDTIAAQLQQGRFCLNLGGDHSIAIGTISAVARAKTDFCVLWIDAHADINSVTTTSSGNMHGMPVSFLMGLNKGTGVPGFDWLPERCLPPSHIAYIGLRDVEEGERRYLKENHILAFSMHEVERWGIGKVVDMALNHINPRNDRALHLSFDVDGLDPAVCPSTGTAVTGGLSFREGRYICEKCWETGRLVSMDVVEVNPQIDAAGANTTCTNALAMIKSAMGSTLL